jgi:hypothetical protein
MTDHQLLVSTIREAGRIIAEHLEPDGRKCRITGTNEFFGRREIGFLREWMRSF